VRQTIVNTHAHRPRRREFPPEQYQEYLEKHYKPNLVYNVLDTGLFCFAINVISVTVVLPAFCATLGASNTEIALIQAINMVGWFLPQLFLSLHVEKLFRKKPFICASAFMQRLPWLLIGFFAIVLLPGSPRLFLAIFFLLFAVSSVAKGFTSIAWSEMIAKSIPPGKRGFFMGCNQTLGNACSVLGGVVVKYIMEGDHFAYPNNYAALFFLAVVVSMVSFGFLLLIREPLTEHKPNPQNLGQYFRELPSILKKDRNFSSYILSRVLGHANIMAVGFFMVYTIRAFHQPDTIIGTFVLITTVATMVSAILLGWLADARGNKLIVLLSAGSFLISILLAMFATALWQMYLVFILAAVGQSAYGISNNNIIYDFAPEERRPTYIGLANTLTAPIVMIFTLLGGKLADVSRFEYKLVFGIAAVFVGASIWIMLFHVTDPRKTRPPTQPKSHSEERTLAGNAS
jgi:MFS family permease